MKSFLIQFLPWFMSIFSIAALWLAGNKWKHAWKFYFVNEIIWFTWIVISATWGFMPLCLFTMYVAIRNNKLWNVN